MKRYGFDIDGVITRIKLLSELEFFLTWILWRSKQLWKALFSFTVFFPVNKDVRRLIQILYSQGNEIVIVSSRPYFLFHFTKKWLDLNKIPFHRLILNQAKDVDPREFKQQIIKKLKIDYFFDNSARIRKGTLNILPVSAIIKNKHKI